MTVSIKVDGIPQTKAFLSLKNKEALVRVNDAIKKVGFFIETEVVQSIAGQRAEHKSVDTGNFKNSILAVFPKRFTAIIGSNKYPVPYANFLEYGTSTFTGRSHFRNTATRNTQKVNEFIEKEVKKL